MAARVGFELLAQSQYRIEFIGLSKLFYPHIASPLKTSATVRKL